MLGRIIMDKADNVIGDLMAGDLVAINFAETHMVHFLRFFCELVCTTNFSFFSSIFLALKQLLPPGGYLFPCCPALINDVFTKFYEYTIQIVKNGFL